MTSLRQHHLKMVRDQARMTLMSKSKLTRQQLTKEVQRVPFFRQNFKLERLYALVCEAIRLYDEDFYVDPGTKRVALGARAQEWERGKSGTQQQRKRPGGITHAGRIHEALAEAGR